MTSLRSVYIYALRDPYTMACRYVGKSYNPVERMKFHIYESKTGTSHKNYWLNSLFPKQPIIEILEYFELDEGNWSDSERWWIREMRRRGEPITNFADGGEASPMIGKKHTPESIAKIVAVHLGSKRSEETKRKMSEANKNRIYPKCIEGCTCHKHSPETRAKLSKALKGKKSWNEGIKTGPSPRRGIPLTPEHRQKIRENHTTVSGWHKKTIGPGKGKRKA